MGGIFVCWTALMAIIIGLALLVVTMIMGIAAIRFAWGLLASVGA